MDFPYEIRLVDIGSVVTVPDGDNTVSYAVPYTTTFENGSMAARAGEPGPRPPTFTQWGWLIDSVTIISKDDDEEKLAALAREGMESLPDLAHKFMLVYRTGKGMFDSCFLVATDSSDWWQQYRSLRDNERVL